MRGPKRLKASAMMLSLAALVAVALPDHPAHARAAGGGRPAGRPCGPRAATTLAADAVVRVYSVGGNVLGCVAGASRATELGTTGFSVRAGRVDLVRVSGTVAAYGLVRSGVDTASATVVVRRLTTGRVLAQRAATTREGVEGFQAVDGLVVKADGAVAWIATANSIGPPKFVRQVRRMDARGTVTLDWGPAVAAGSLALSGSALRWRHGGLLRRSTLR